MGYYKYTVWTYQDYPDGTRRYGTQEFHFGAETDPQAHTYARLKLKGLRRHYSGILSDQLCSVMASLSEEARERMRKHAEGISWHDEEEEEDELFP